LYCNQHNISNWQHIFLTWWFELQFKELILTSVDLPQEYMKEDIYLIRWLRGNFISCSDFFKLKLEFWYLKNVLMWYFQQEITIWEWRKPCYLKYVIAYMCAFLLITYWIVPCTFGYDSAEFEVEKDEQNGQNTFRELDILLEKLSILIRRKG